jgi:hypothetical protein
MAQRRATLRDWRGENVNRQVDSVKSEDVIAAEMHVHRECPGHQEARRRKPPKPADIEVADRCDVHDVGDVIELERNGKAIGESENAHKRDERRGRQPGDRCS